MYEPTRQERRIEESINLKLVEFMNAYTSKSYATPEEAREAYDSFNKQWRAFCTSFNNRKKIKRLNVRANQDGFRKYAEELGVKPAEEGKIISLNQK